MSPGAGRAFARPARSTNNFNLSGAERRVDHIGLRCHKTACSSAHLLKNLLMFEVRQPTHAVCRCDLKLSNAPGMFLKFTHFGSEQVHSAAGSHICFKWDEIRPSLS
ncbi:hypothetical protein RRG08_054499 [Elysia crispata]|uniref:Uncharacterized protein n=1 Tax=Elysia crispata TaxID=231223 RepID=A0AAE0YUI8_9GAST|nr:hypothetical protein RRG08_054499 [Elysia crispata]